MNTDMSILDQFITDYNAIFSTCELVYDNSISGLVTKSTKLLLDEKLSPPPELEAILNKLHLRAKEPMKVAITGQFSSGKSTFLNALLSKNILPTGITPVTSKVNYIRYADEYKIRVHHTDGRDEYRDIEDIARFTDQRGDEEDIEYLTLYAPLDMLKEITFVDTPGLNSQDDKDTITTQNVLKEVDGIIWLSLIDNAGKMSEAQTLEKYMNHYQGKSLCVLNQKDKFTPEQIERSVGYVQKTFSQFFSQVTPISARDALLSRSHDKAIKIQEQTDKLLDTIRHNLQNSEEIDIAKLYSTHKDNISEIENLDPSKNQELLQSSNINSVLDFIENHIRPASVDAKEYSIKKDLEHIYTTTIKQHKLFISIYDELESELGKFDEEAKAKLSQLQKEFGDKLQNAYMKIEEIIEVISNDIYSHITQTSRTRYTAKKSGLLKQSTVYEATDYKSVHIESDKIYKHLFYDDDIVGKMFKKYVKSLKAIQDEVNQNNVDVYEMLKRRIRAWQGPYELLRKQEPVHSYIEFANIRKFASKAFENILKPFSDQIHYSYAKVSSEFNHLSSAVSFNYQNATQVSVAQLEQKIEQSVKMHESDPSRFALYTPKLDDIKQRLTQSFHLYELENMMVGKKTFLSKNYDTLMREFEHIQQSNKELLRKRKDRHIKTIELLNAQLEDFKV